MLKLRFGLALAVATVALVAPTAAQAENVAPNPGVEAGRCDGPRAITPIICGWRGYGVMSQGAAHSGNFGMSLNCGVHGCYSDPFVGWVSLGASTDWAFCAAIGPGNHFASFWYWTDAPGMAGLSAAFF